MQPSQEVVLGGRWGAKEPGRDILGQGLWEQSPHSGRGKGAVLQRLGEEGTRPGGADALGRSVGAGLLTGLEAKPRGWISPLRQSGAYMQVT